MKQESAELRRMLKELKSVEDQISFLKSWLRILGKKPEYVE
ncbi:MAG: hypothetical protein OEY81_03225 [Candidatus Bathyarchaeota archaeon]|nr:hypothetical protein [Candidatus Bathyarchaeota archaeon]